MSDVVILETKAGVFLSHFEDDKLQSLNLADFSDKTRPGDIFKGRIQRIEGPRLWIDLGLEKPGLLTIDKKMTVGEAVYVRIDRIPLEGKGAKVSLTSVKDDQINSSSQPTKIHAVSEEWLTYLYSLPEPVMVTTNSARIFHQGRQDSALHQYILKSDIRPTPLIDDAWKSLLDNRIEIAGGGWIIIEEIETLTAIDVNTSGGEFIRSDLREDRQWLHFNQLCAKVILSQLSLRQMGGLIVIDFPRMKEKKNQTLLFETMMKLKDKKTQILGFTRSGLFEMTLTKNHHSLPKRLKNNNLWSSYLELS